MKIVYLVLTILMLALCGAGFYVSPLRPMILPIQVALPINAPPYILQTPAKPLTAPQFALPDISGYTTDNVIQKIPPAQAGTITLQPMVETAGLEKFLETIRANEFSKLQNRPDPVAIAVQTGVNTLDDVVAAVNSPAAIEKTANGDYVLKVPLVVYHGATLNASGTPEKKLMLKMSSVTGGFIVNVGQIFIVDSEVVSWDDVKNEEAAIDDKTPKVFRPFFAAWNNSDTYFARSSFKHLGYAASKSYGISFSTDKTLMKQVPPPPSPRGWLVDNRFEGLHYGFYSYEAEGIVIVNNVYANNIVYGIDPHDRSKHLIIAGNEAYGTLKKHGIIASREVNDSWIFNNKSHHNAGSGFMLDRTCVRNILANNVAYDNGTDGLTLFESQDNILANNTLTNNGKHGLRLRNSWNVTAINNTMIGNAGVGLQVYATPINDEERDLLLDPYTQRAGIDVIGGTFDKNVGGSLKFENFERLGLIGITIPFMKKTDFRVELSPFREELPDILATNPNGIEIVRIVTDATAGSITTESQETGEPITATDQSEKEDE